MRDLRKLHMRLKRRNPWYSGWHAVPYISAFHFIMLAGFVAYGAPLFFGALTVNPGEASAAPSEQSLEALTTQVLRLSSQIPNTPAGEHSKALETLSGLVAKRQSVLAAQAALDPHYFLLYALPEDVSAELPDEIQPLLETHVDLDAELTVIHVDAMPGNKGHEETLYELKSGGKKYRLFFDGDAPEGVMTGAQVRVKGVAVKDVLVAAAGDITVVSDGTAAAAVMKNAIIILFNFTDNTSQPFTKEQIAATIFTNPNSTNNYYQENSYDQMGMAGDVVGWYTIPYTNTNCSSMYSTWSAAADQAAAAAGVNLSNYSHRIYIWNTSAGCGWGGLGTIGGNPSRAWIPGYNNPTIIAHEFGHNIGGQHAQWLKCGAVSIAPYANCTTDEYGDPSDVMGYNWTHYYQYVSPRKIGATWLNAIEHEQVVSQSGIYTVGAGENNVGVKVLKIAKPDTNEAYYVSYRQATGFDANIPSAFVNGASIHIWSGAFNRQTKLIDTTPGDNSATNAPLTDGRYFNDPANGLTITQASHSSSSVTVQVDFGTVSCVRIGPTVTLSPTSQSGAPEAARSYSLTVTNNDNSGCESSTFDLTSSVPSGWLGVLSASSLTLGPGAQGSATLTVTPPTGTLDGSYSVGATANDLAVTGHSGSGSATYVSIAPVVDTTPPAVTINSPSNGAKLKGNANVNVGASASDASGIATLTITIDGVLVKTCTNVTTCSYSWSGKTIKPGTHTIVATATDKAAAANQGTASITVTK